ncbi:hypothetical protein BT69DRAFT_333661 [Atractiella rhizophila]|nr:hypothetical protein BT69DRAFT_333661 [Atractiella rhizophila]
MGTWSFPLFAAVGFAVASVQELSLGGDAWECSNSLLCSQIELPWSDNIRKEAFRISSLATLSQTFPAIKDGEYSITFSAVADHHELIPVLLQFGDFYQTIDIYPNFNGPNTLNDYTVLRYRVISFSAARSPS